MSTVSYPHIQTSDDGVATIAGTTTKVVEVVLDHIAHHWHAEEIQRQHPYLSMAQIHAALTYYYDHQQTIDDEIEAGLRQVAEIKDRRKDSTLRDKLRTMKLLP